MTAKLVSITPDAETTMLYVARVSSPNQDNPTSKGLLKYCLDHEHWSVFEHAFATLELTTSRAISAQILRHRSFAFSEFSQRYSSDIHNTDPVRARRQSDKNRQSSTEICDQQGQNRLDYAWDQVWNRAFGLYNDLLDCGVSREQARMILPLSTATRLYMSGSVRSWIHYVNLRCKPDTQQEHREIAEACRNILAKELPTIANALEWTNG